MKNSEIYVKMSLKRNRKSKNIPKIAKNSKSCKTEDSDFEEHDIIEHEYENQDSSLHTNNVLLGQLNNSVNNKKNKVSKKKENFQDQNFEEHDIVVDEYHQDLSLIHI